MNKWSALRPYLFFVVLALAVGGAAGAAARAGMDAYAGLIALVLAMSAQFSRRDPAAAWLCAPYLLWLLFAAYLNLGVWLLNR